MASARYVSLRRMWAAVGLSAAMLIQAGWLAAEDWPCHRGPRRDGVSREANWLVNWPGGKTPSAAWDASVGKGHSAVAVAGGLCYTMGFDGKSETVFCLDAVTGREKWKRSYAAAGRYEWPGPRATPTVEGNTVYTLGQRGHLKAYDTLGGRLRWEVQIAEAAIPDDHYGHCWSPLVDGNLLVLGAGQRGLAIDKATGKIAWGDDQHRGTCASAVPYEHRGRRGVVVAVTTDRATIDLVGVDPSDGRELWRFPGWPEKYGDFCADPIVRDGKVFLTTAETNYRCARISFDGNKPVKDWESDALPSNTGQCVLHQGRLFGLTRRGKLTCVDWATGRRIWEQPGFGDKGSLMLATGRLIVLTGKGDLVVAEADPKAYRELRRAPKVVGQTFTPPVLSHGRIYCRDYAGRLVCLDLTDKP